MTLELKTWYVVETVSVSAERLVARFLPDWFLLHEGEPVLTLAVEHPSDHAAASRLVERFRDDPAVEIAVSSGVIELWAEYDDEPTRLLGAETHHAWSAYAAEDLLRIARSLEDQLNTVHAENAKLQAEKRDLEDFINELLRRAETKKSLSTKSTASAEAKIDALERVLNRLTGV